MNYIYIIGELRPKKLKIGRATNVTHRLRTIQTGHPEPLTIHYSFEVGDSFEAKTVEYNCHKKLQKQRYRGEWFNVSLKKAVETVQELIAERHTPIANLKRENRQFVARMRQPEYADDGF